MSELTLQQAIRLCRTQDVPRLRGRLRKLKPGQDKTLLEADVEKSLNAVQARYDSRPKLEYPAELPVVQQRASIIEAIREHQVVVLCGETGSGKTTQLPKLCLEAGQGMRGLIGHTQPRRLAARNVAQRIAEELHSELGAAVGYQVRFNEQVSEQSYIKLMTDGILLAETRDDRWLNRYDTIIIDEAHERSLNIDFLLGYLAQLLPKRKDLKVIITSATIDPQRFADFFEQATGNPVPMLTAEGRSYPVALRYRFNAEHNQPQAIEAGLRDLWQKDPGDVLVFLPGERDIREAANHLSRASLPDAEILPLYARLSSAQQQRIFNPGGRRRIILATNVAETSITVPGIRHVIDTGVARISRYSHRSKVQRLPIEPISQASADQRKGRCGRTSAGTCVRLYEEADFITRPVFTEPEIRRTNLANVLLQMYDLRLGDIEAFPFLDAPDSRFVRDGLRLLEQLGAINAKGLTRVGKQMARLPLDPRLARVLVAAEHSKCLHEALIIVSGLSIQDPRDRPSDFQQAADEAHKVYNDEASDFLSWLKLWQATREQRKALSGNQYQRWCKTNFLSPLRLHEWQDVHQQLLQQCRALHWDIAATSTPADFEKLHKVLLHGLLDRIGLKEEAEAAPKVPAGRSTKGRRKPPVIYQGARNTNFSIHPSSALQKTKPQWLMAWEVVETTRVYARSLAKVEPAWLEQVGRDQIKRSYSDPHWSKRQGDVMAKEQLSLFGLIIAANRKARYADVDPVESRKIFIRQALVAAEYRDPPSQKARGAERGKWLVPEFIANNQALRDEVEQFEAKARRRDVLVDESALTEFYEQRIPSEVVGAESFRAWYKQILTTQPDLLFFDRDFLIRDDAELAAGELFPEFIDCGAVRLQLRYAFEPGKDKDGISVDIPAQLLNQLDRNRLDWLVLGLIEDKVTAMIRALPKARRRNFVPAPDFASAAYGRMEYAKGNLLESLAKALREISGGDIGAEEFADQALEPHLSFRYNLLDVDGKTLASSRELNDFTHEHKQVAQEAFQAAKQAGGQHELEQSGLTAWDFADLPEVVSWQRNGITSQAWPALVDGGDSVSIRLLDNDVSAQQLHRQGLRRLAEIKLKKTQRYIQKQCDGADRVATRLCAGKQPNTWQQAAIRHHYSQLAGRWPGLLDEFTTVLVGEMVVGAVWPEKPILKASDFGLMVYEQEPNLVPQATELWKQLKASAEQVQLIRGRLEKLGLRAMQASQDIQMQLNAMFFPGFIAAWGLQAISQYPRYLQGLNSRIDKLDSNPNRDAGWQNQIAPFYQQLFSKLETQPEFLNKPGVREYRWLLEEFRIGLFAQPQKPREVASAKRLDKLWKELKE